MSGTQVGDEKRALKRKLWTLVSKCCRLSYADRNGFVACFTCGKSYLWNSGTIHAGHWIHNVLSVKFNPDNIRPQCYRCNHFYSGMRSEFGTRLRAEGVDTQALIGLSKQPVNWTVWDYEEKIAEWETTWEAIQASKL